MCVSGPVRSLCRAMQTAALHQSHCWEYSGAFSGSRHAPRSDNALYARCMAPRWPSSVTGDDGIGHFIRAFFANHWTVPDLFHRVNIPGARYKIEHKSDSNRSESLRDKISLKRMESARSCRIHAERAGTHIPRIALAVFYTKVIVMSRKSLWRVS